MSPFRFWPWSRTPAKSPVVAPPCTPPEQFKSLTELVGDARLEIEKRRIEVERRAAQMRADIDDIIEEIKGLDSGLLMHIDSGVRVVPYSDTFDCMASFTISIPSMKVKLECREFERFRLQETKKRIAQWIAAQMARRDYEPMKSQQPSPGDSE